MTTKMKFSCIALAMFSVSGCASLAPSDAPRIVGHQVVEHGSMTDAEAQYALGKYYLGQNRAALALLAFTRALEADPRHAEAYNARATAFVHLGDLERAESDLARAIDVSPDAVHLRSNQGYVRILRGEYAGAAESLRRAFELDPRNKRVAANWKLLASRVSTNPVLAQKLRLPSGGEQAGLEPSRNPEPTRSVVTALSEVLSGPVINLPAPRSSKVQDPSPPALSKARGSAFPKVTTNVVNLSHPSPGLTAAGAPASVTVAPPPTFSARRIEMPRPASNADSVSSPSRERTEAMPASESVRRTSFASPSSAILNNALSIARIEVSNGNGIRGMAAKFSTGIPLLNYEVVRVTNAPRFDYEQTRIYFREGFLQQALQLSRALPVPVAVMLNNDIARRSDLQVIIGRDLATRKVAATNRIQTPALAASAAAATMLR